MDVVGCYRAGSAGPRILELGAGAGRATALLVAGGARLLLALDLLGALRSG